MSRMSDQPCTRCSSALFRDESEWVCAICSRRQPAPPLPASQPREPPNRCLVCNMPGPAGHQTCGEPVCYHTLYTSCQNCQAVIAKRAANGNLRRYCDQACANAWHSRQRLARREAERIAKGCRLCGHIIRKPPAGSTGRPRRYCSTACRQAARDGKMPPAPGLKPLICLGCAAVFYPKPGPGRKPYYYSPNCPQRAAARGAALRKVTP